MKIPVVTFPISQEEIKAKYEELYSHLRAIQSEERMTQSLMAEIRRWCKHPNAKNSRCPDCGSDWSD